MSEWSTLCLGELIDSGDAELQTGPFGTQLSASEYVQEGVPVVNVRNIGIRQLIDSELEYIKEETAFRLHVHGLNEKDIVFCRKGAVGRHLLVTRKQEGWVQGSDCMRLRIKCDSISPDLLSYYFSTQGHKDWMEAQCSFGATMSSLNQGVIRRIKVSLPPLPIQQKIAAILSAYDDLIENNNRRIALLEKMAEEVYREWFVRLRFPGHERLPLHQGVPEGWSVASLSEMCDSIDYGYTASGEEAAVGPKFLRITDIVPNLISWDSVPHCRIDQNRLEQFRLKEGDIVIARTGATVGYAKRIRKRHPEAVFASYLVRLRLSPAVDNVLIGIFVESEQYKNFIRCHVGGAAQPNANAKVLSSAKLLMPTVVLQTRFRRLTEPLLNQMDTCQFENQRLSECRDMLLSRLLSGKLDVEQLDIQFPPAMCEAENGGGSHA